MAGNEKFETFRKGFPALDKLTYFSICDKCILHKEVRQSVDYFLDHLTFASANRTDHEVHVNASREKFARLVNTDTSTIAAIRNVSDGVNSVAWAMPWNDGDNVIISLDHEHPNNIYPWLRLQKNGIKLRNIKSNPDGSLDIKTIIDSIDNNTKLVACASVSYAPGHRIDLQRLGEACRKKDVFLLVDGVQSAGILHHDLTAECVDGFMTSTSKGLLGLYGYGFLYISPQWIDRLQPAYLSRPAVLIDNTAHSVMGNTEYEYQPDSQRFHVGSFNLAGAYAASKSLDLLLSLGTENIETQVLELTTQLYDAMTGLGLKTVLPRKGEGSSHIFTVGEIDAGSHGVSSDPQITKISEALFEADIIHTIRRGQLRFGLHGFNNRHDIDKATDVVKSVV